MNWPWLRPWTKPRPCTDPDSGLGPSRGHALTLNLTMDQVETMNWTWLRPWTRPRPWTDPNSGHGLSQAHELTLTHAEAMNWPWLRPRTKSRPWTDPDWGYDQAEVMKSTDHDSGHGPWTGHGLNHKNKIYQKLHPVILDNHCYCMRTYTSFNNYKVHISWLPAYKNNWLLKVNSKIVATHSLKKKIDR